MSSRFVSAGTIDAPIERDEAWLAAQQEVEAKQRRQVEEARQPPQKSLFETLQANNAAKQEAFEEAAKLKNQFRALDEDEIEFLDSVLESTRAEEERVRRETAEGLEAFRKQQEAADKKLRAGQTEGEQPTSGEVGGEDKESWTTMGPRKRKRTKEKEGFRGLKLRKPSTSEGEQSFEKEPGQKPEEANVESGKKTTRVGSPSETSAPISSSKGSRHGPHSSKVAKPGLGLVDYGSDDD